MEGPECQAKALCSLPGPQQGTKVSEKRRALIKAVIQKD